MNCWNICWKLQQMPCTDLCSLQHLITQNCLRVLTQIVPARALWLLMPSFPWQCREFVLSLALAAQCRVVKGLQKMIFGNTACSYTDVRFNFS